MNRVLKFRVWDNEDRRMFSPMELFEICYEYDGGNISFNGNYIFRQFTGMSDKNGTEIYEGDIVAENHDGEEGEANVGQVFFAAGSFMIDGDTTLHDHTFSLTPHLLEDYLVVGNIFENPELL